MNRAILIIAGCLLFAAGLTVSILQGLESPQGLLDLAVAVWLLLLFVCGAAFGLGLPSNKAFATHLPALGLLWFFLSGYAVFALAAMLVAHVLLLPFGVSCVVQAALLVSGIVAMLVIPGAAVRKAEEVQRKEAVGIVSLDELRQDFETRFRSIAPQLAETPELARRFRLIGEDLRCLASASGKEAQRLERELVQSLPALFGPCAGEGQALRQEEVLAALDRFSVLLQKRRACRAPNDHKENFS